MPIYAVDDPRRLQLLRDIEDSEQRGAQTKELLAKIERFLQQFPDDADGLIAKGRYLRNLVNSDGEHRALSPRDIVNQSIAALRRGIDLCEHDLSRWSPNVLANGYVALSLVLMCRIDIEKLHPDTEDHLQTCYESIGFAIASYLTNPHDLECVEAARVHLDLLRKQSRELFREVVTVLATGTFEPWMYPGLQYMRQALDGTLRLGGNHPADRCRLLLDIVRLFAAVAPPAQTAVDDILNVSSWLGGPAALEKSASEIDKKCLSLISFVREADYHEEVSRYRQVTTSRKTEVGLSSILAIELEQLKVDLVHAREVVPLPKGINPDACLFLLRYRARRNLHQSVEPWCVEACRMAFDSYLGVLARQPGVNLVSKKPLPSNPLEVPTRWKVQSDAKEYGVVACKAVSRTGEPLQVSILIGDLSGGKIGTGMDVKIYRALLNPDAGVLRAGWPSPFVLSDNSPKAIPTTSFGCLLASIIAVSGILAWSVTLF